MQQLPEMMRAVRLTQRGGVPRLEVKRVENWKLGG